MPAFFVPARSSRHRTACFALYRALIRTGRRVPLPDHVAGDPRPGRPYVHPIQRFVRHAFRLNRGDTSPRLVVTALHNGYKGLALLTGAQTPGSAAHQQVVAALAHRAPPRRSNRSYGRTPKPRHMRPGPQAAVKPRPPNAVPLVRRRRIPGSETTTVPAEVAQAAAAGAGGPAAEVVAESRRGRRRPVGYYFYEYVPAAAPRPLSDFPGGAEHGRRPVPRLTTDASGIPFLRMGRPQSPALSQLLRHKGRKRRERAQLSSQLARDGLAFAQQEDLWEANLARGLRAAGEPPQTWEPIAAEARAATYRQTVAAVIAYLNAKLNVETADMLARAKAYLQIVDRERGLAEEEERARRQRLAEQNKGGP